MAVTLLLHDGKSGGDQLDATNIALLELQTQITGIGGPGGTNTTVQFNNLGLFGGSTQFVFDGTAVGIGAPAPVASSLLELASTTRGFLLPRMTTTQRDAIGSPAAGLEIYNTTTNELQFFNGSIWQNTGVTAPGGADTQVQFNNSGAFDGISGVTTSGNDLLFADNISLVLGNSSDLVINNTGNLQLINGTGGDLLLQSTSATNKILNKLGTDTTATSFHVRNNSNADLLTVFGDGEVGIGVTGIPDSKLHVFNGSAGVVTATPNTVLTLESSSSCILTLLSSDANDRAIFFGEPSSNAAGRINYNGVVNDGFVFSTNFATDVMAMLSDGRVGIGTNSPNTDALLELASTTQGFLMPRMTTTQRNAIVTPPTGLEIYNTTTNEPEFFNGSIWLNTGATAPGGASGEVQFNNAGVFGGISGVRSSGSELLLNNNIELFFGTVIEGRIVHDGTNLEISNNLQLSGNGGDLSLLQQDPAGGDILLDNQGTASDIILQLGTTGSTTAVRMQNSSATDLVTVLGSGDVGVGIPTPDSRLHVHDGTAGAITAIAGTVLTVENNTDSFISILSPDASERSIIFGEPSSNIAGTIRYNNASVLDGFIFQVNAGTDAVSINSLGHLGIGHLNPDTPLHVHDGDAGAVTSPAGTVIVSESDGNNFISLQSPDANARGIFFSEPSNSIAGGIIYNQDVTDGFSWRTAGTGAKMVLTDVGNLGLGINPPLSRFHILENNSSTDSSVGLTIEQDGSGDALLHFLLSGTNRWIMGIDNSDADKFKIALNADLANSLFVLTTGGSIGLGTNSPDPSAILDLSSTTQGFSMPDMTTAQRNAIVSPKTGLEIYNTTTNEPEFFDGSIWLNTGATAPGGLDTEVQFNDSGVFNGITGVTTAGSNLIIAATSAVNFGDTLQFNIFHNNTLARLVNATGDLEILNAGTGNILIDAQGATAETIIRTGTDTSATSFNVQNNSTADLLTVLGSGRVLIGDPVLPQAKLHIYENNTATDSGLLIEQDGTGDAIAQFLITAQRRWIIGVDNSDNDRFKISSNADLGSSTHLEITDGGNVGIGISPDTRLHVQDGSAGAVTGSRQLTVEGNAALSGISLLGPTSTVIAFGNPAGGEFDGSLAFDSTAQGGFVFAAGGSNRMAITDSGDVGIDTTAPQDRLEVVGDIVSKGTDWTLRVSPNQGLRDVAWGNGRFVGITGSGAGNRVLTSDDGVDWVLGTSAADNNWQRIIYGNGLFVAVAATGTGDRIMTSPDGITWTSRTNPVDNQWQTIAYGNGVFVATAATGTGDRAMTSPDGITWTIQTTPVDNNWFGLTFGNGLFVAVATTGTGNRVMTSPDGVTWTSRTSASDNVWRGVEWGNGLFVVVGTTGAGDRVMTSPDGITWTLRTSAANNDWIDITYGNGLFVAVAATGTDRVMTSIDGINWITRPTPTASTFLAVAYGNGVFVSFASTGGATDKIITSGRSTEHINPDENIFQGDRFFTGAVGIGINPPDNRLHIFENNSLGGADAGVTIEQAGGTGDSVLHFEIPTQIFSTGVESDDEIYVIAPGVGLSPTPNYFAMDSTGRVTIGDATPQAGSILSLRSTEFGFTPPRMTRAQLDAIASLTAGMQGHNTSTNIPSYFSGTRWLPMSDPTNVISITSQADWDALVSGGTITIASNTTILVKTFISTADEIVINSGVNFSLLGSDIASAAILYTGAGTFITSDGVSVLRIFGFGSLNGNFTGTLLSIINGGQFFRIQDMGIFNWAGLGTVTNSFVFEIVNAGIFNTGSKLVLDDVQNIALDGANLTNFISDTADSLVQIKSSTLADLAITVTLTSTQLQPTESLLQIDPAIGSGSTIVVNNNSLAGTNKALFNPTSSTGAFSAVANSSVASTSITSVTDSSGVARFNFTPGPALFVNQEVGISGFTTNTAYNGTFIITATGAGFFEVSSIAFGSNETGSFSIDTVTLTDTATTLSDGDTITVDTDFATDYDGGAIVYNQLTNSFQINRVFVATQSGTWDTKALDQKDLRLLAFLNPGVVDSKYIGSVLLNSGTATTTITTQNVWVDVDLDGSADGASNIERWKVIDADTGEIEYTGIEPFDGAIGGSFSILAPGAQNYELRGIKNGVATAIEGIEIPFATDSASGTFPIQIPVTAVTGDSFRFQVRNIDGTDDIDFTDLSEDIA